MEFHPDPGMNVICGENAQGKTNLLEAMYLFSGMRSFRGAKDHEYLAFGQKECRLSMSFFDGERTQDAELRIGVKKKAFLNRVPLESVAGLSGSIYTVVFSPEHISLVKSAPQIRRRFMDTAIAQIKPDYGHFLSQYERVLNQRNILLKDLRQYAALRDTMDIWDQQLAKLGTILTIYRQDYLHKLQKFSKTIYEGISRRQEDLSLSYISTVFSEEWIGEKYDDARINQYFEALCAAREQDVRQGFTSVGVHRDDLEMKINGLSVKNFASQGQQRSCALTLKLAEARLLEKINGQQPVIFLDDVMSELDQNRQEYILNYIGQCQVFITCCDVLNTLRMRKGKIFMLADGKICTEQTL